MTISESDLYYLESIQRQLRDVKEALADTASFSLRGLAFADNMDWLDCFIAKHREQLTAAVSSEISGAK